MKEFVEIKELIVRTRSGNTRTTEVLATSKDLSEEFLDMLWNDFGIDIEELELIDKEKLKAVNVTSHHVDEIIDDLNIPEDSSTAQCRKILKKHNINYDDLDPDNLDCDICPGFDECVIAFTGRS